MKDQWLSRVCAALGWQGGTIHQVLEEIERLRNAAGELRPPEQAAPSAPVGWKLVPAELTEEMRRVGFAASAGKLGAQALWRAMLAAAPAPAEAPVVPVADDLVTVGAMHKCRPDDPFSRCVMCGAMAGQLAKPCKEWMAEARVAPAEASQGGGERQPVDPQPGGA